MQNIRIINNDNQQEDLLIRFILTKDLNTTRVPDTLYSTQEVI